MWRDDRLAVPRFPDTRLFLNFDFFFILSERKAKMNNKRGKIREKNFTRSRIIEMLIFETLKGL